ncbi:MAG: HAD family phosphatase [Clostridia bacterium]|nr:HAD family phosphatase [Clostridia bacterium]
MVNTDTMKAAIFDMDGTLLDSMSEWRRLNGEFVRSRGITPTQEQEAEMFSISGTMLIPYLKERFGITSDFDTLCEAACRAMEPVYAAGVSLKPGAAQYLRRLGERGVKCVLATATPARPALIALNKAGLVSRLDFIYSVDMIGGQKSDADFYDRLCGLIGERREDCVMFEDSLYAMRGARAAGLGVVGITDRTNERDREAIRAVCDLVIDSFDELA